MPIHKHFEKDEERLSILYHQYIKYLVRTPRELKRIFNNLRFVLAQTEGMVSFTDLFCLSVISIKAQNVYQSFKNSPEMYVGRSFDTGYSFEKEEEVVKKYKEKRETLLNQCADRDKVYIEGLLKELFPLLDESSSGEEYDRLGRVASEKRLYIALHYQVPTGFAADTDIRDYISGNIDREEYLNRAIRDNFVDRFFDLIYQNINNVSSAQVLGILSSLYKVFLHSEYLTSLENAAQGFFGFEPFRNIIWVTNKLIDKSDDKLSLITDLVNNQNYLPVTADILRRLMIQNKELEADDPRQLKKKWLEDSDYSTVKNNWSQVAISELENGTLLNSVYASHVFYVLYRVAEDRVRELFNGWLNQSDGVEKIAKLIGRSGSDSTNGPYAQIDETTISKLLNLKTLKEKASAELSSGKELSNYLKAVYLNISTGDKYYLNNAEKGDKF